MRFTRNNSYYILLFTFFNIGKPVVLFNIINVLRYLKFSVITAKIQLK